MATCAQCQFYDFTDENKYGECFCSYRERYYPRGDSICSNSKDREDNGGCFITTVIVNVLGYGDKCIYLENLRRFRDNHMKNNSIFQPLLDEYNIVGPVIAESITTDKEKTVLAESLFETYIVPTCQLIDSGDYTEAVSTYKRMVLFLKKRYLIR